MAESWIQKLRREMRETEAAVRAALRIEDAWELRAELERLVARRGGLGGDGERDQEPATQRTISV